MPESLRTIRQRVTWIYHLIETHLYQDQNVFEIDIIPVLRW